MVSIPIGIESNEELVVKYLDVKYEKTNWNTAKNKTEAIIIFFTFFLLMLSQMK
jgi:hypothetical protein